MTLDNKTYDVIKWIAQYFLPALATLWITLAKIWNLPYGTEIGATITGIDLFLGAILGISSQNYKGDGTMTVDTSDEAKDVYSLNLNAPVEELANKETITFKVNKK
jgi:hypothetical protein